MADVRSGGAFWEVYVKDEKFRKGVANVEKQMRDVSRTTLSVGKSLTALGVTGAAAFAPAIKSASDLEEVVNKFNVVFKDNAKAVRAWGKSFGEEVGRSERQILEFLGNSQDLLVPLGLDRDAAEETSKQLTKLALDLGSFHNMADGDAMRDLHAALTGSGEVMKKYGVVVSAATTNQELLNMQLDPKAATEAQKAMARLTIIMGGTTAAQGDAMRSAGSFANQTKALKAELENTSATIGKAVLPALTDIVSLASSAADAVGDFAGEHPEAIRVMGGLTIAAGAGGTALLTLGVALSTASSALQVYNGISRAAQAGTLTLEGTMSKAGMAAKSMSIAVAGIALGAIAFEAYQAAAGIDSMNAELAKSIQLANDLANLTSEQDQDFIAEIATLPPAQQVKALEEKLAAEEKRLEGSETAIASAQSFRADQRDRTQSKRDRFAGVLTLIEPRAAKLNEFAAEKVFQPDDDEAAARIEAAKAERDRQKDRVRNFRRQLVSAKALTNRFTGPADVSVPAVQLPEAPPIQPPRIPEFRTGGYSPEVLDLVSQSRFAPAIREELGVGGRGGNSQDLLKRLTEQNAELLAVNKDMRRELKKSPVVVGER